MSVTNETTKRKDALIMKLLKKTLAVMLVVLTLFTLVSCDKIEGILNGENSKDKDTSGEKVTIVASWSADVKYMNFASQLLESNATLADVIKDINLDSYLVKTTLTFKEDGTYTYVFDKESMDKAINDFANDLLTQVYNANFSNSDAAMSLEEFIKASKANITDLFPPESVLTVNGKYEYSENKLYVTSTPTDELSKQSYVTVELTASTLKFNEAVGEAPLLPESLLPITYNKTK